MNCRHRRNWVSASSSEQDIDRDIKLQTNTPSTPITNTDRAARYAGRNLEPVSWRSNYCIIFPTSILAAVHTSIFKSVLFPVSAQILIPCRHIQIIWGQVFAQTYKDCELSLCSWL